MTEKSTHGESERKIKGLGRKQPGQPLTPEPDSKTNPEIPIPELELKSLIDVLELQSIMDDFHQLTHMATAILDLDGNIIEATGWQDLCTKFHRVNPQTARRCTESDLFLAKNLKPGEYVDYQCKNGLWDVVTPLYVGTKHLGNIYTGQFFYRDEAVDEEFFVKQAEAFGFDKDAYLEAFRRIPRYDRATVHYLMSFLVKFTTYISKISFSNSQLEKEIRQRRKAENALMKREAHLRTLIETIPDLIWLKDPDGVYLSCNPKFERFFGAKEADIVGKTDYDFVNKELADFFREKDQAAMAEGKPGVNEEEIVFADDGHKELLETVKTPMYDAEGNLVGVLGIARDVTARKLAEEALRETDRIKNEFISTAAHELRTPLTAVMGFAELLTQDPLSEEKRREYLTIVIDKAQHLEELIGDLLDLSRIQAGGHISLDRQLCDINEAIGNWADQFRKKELKYRFEYSLPTTPVMLYADRDKILRVLENLVRNAIKFSSPPSRIFLSGEVVDGSYQVCVEDEGIGMTPAQIDRIFDNFYRVNASNTAPGGLGLGLSIARTIIQAHHGEISVDSALNRGTRICFKLALAGPSGSDT